MLKNTDFNDFPEAAHCSGCGKFLSFVPEQCFGCGIQIMCDDCSIASNGMTCANCFEKKRITEFANKQSLICNKCFSWREQPEAFRFDIKKAVSTLLYADKMRAIEDAHRTEIKKLQSKIYKLESRIDELEEKYERAPELENMLEKSHVELNKKLSDASKEKKKYTVSEEEAKLILDLIDKGTFTLEDIVSEIMNNFKLDGTAESLEARLKTGFSMFINNCGICSATLYNLEKAIREGKSSIKIDDLRPSGNVLYSFMKSRVMVCKIKRVQQSVMKRGTKKQIEIEELDESQMVSSRELYNAFVEFSNQYKHAAMSEKEFSQEIEKLLNKEGVKKTKSNGRMVFKGIALLESDEDGSENEASNSSDDE